MAYQDDNPFRKKQPEVDNPFRKTSAQSTTEQPEPQQPPPKFEESLRQSIENVKPYLSNQERLGAAALKFVGNIPGAEAIAGAISAAQGKGYQKGRQEFAINRDVASQILGPASGPIGFAGRVAPYVALAPVTGTLGATVAGRTALSALLEGIRAASSAKERAEEAPTMKEVASSGLRGATTGAISNLLIGEPVAAAAGALINPNVATSVIDKFSQIKRPSLGAAVKAEEEATKAAAGPLYEQYLSQPTPVGPARVPQSLANILDLPIIQRATETVRGESPRLASLPPYDPRVLDAVFKRVGQRAFASKHGFEATEAKEALGTAMDDLAQLTHGPEYSPAVRAAARGYSKENALALGSDALHRLASGGALKAEEAAAISPDAIKQWAKTVTPEERSKAIEGVFAQLKQWPTFSKVGAVPVPIAPTTATRRAVELLQALGQMPTPLQRVVRGGISSGIIPD